MSRFSDRLVFRLALIGALAAAFGLAGCGRKAGLDPPPSVSATGQQKSGKTDLIRTPAGKTSPSAAEQTPNKSFILDPLLN